MILLHRVVALIAATSGLAFVGARTIPKSNSSNDTKVGCRVKGVWELVSVSHDGKDDPLNGYKEWKVVTNRHWMWLGQAARRDTLPLKTQVDTLRAYQTPGGAGTYTVSGNTYVENIDLFVEPSGVGTAWKATCRVEGNRWYHSFTVPNDTTKAPGPYRHDVEVWRRVE